MEDSPVIKNVLAVGAYFKRSGVDPSSIEHSGKFGPVVTLDRTVSREGPIVGVTETPPGATASPSEVRVAVWVNTSPVSPGDNPPVAENIVVRVKEGAAEDWILRISSSSEQLSMGGRQETRESSSDP